MRRPFFGAGEQCYKNQGAALEDQNAEKPFLAYFRIYSYDARVAFKAETVMSSLPKPKSLPGKPSGRERLLEGSPPREAAGRKSRAKALKSFVWRKENEG